MNEVDRSASPAEAETPVADGDVVDLANDDAADGDNSTAASEPNSQLDRTRARFLRIARGRAAHFAHFTDDPEGEISAAHETASNTSTQRRDRRAERERAERDWPGPFATARQLVEARAAAAEARSQAQEKGADKGKEEEAQTFDIPWKPKWERDGADETATHKIPAADGKPVASGDSDSQSRSTPTVVKSVGKDGGVVRSRISRLYDLCLAVVSAHASEVETLDGVPDAVRRDLSRSMSVRRAVDGRMLRLLVDGVSSELVVADCSLASEDDLREALAMCDKDRLEVRE